MRSASNSFDWNNLAIGMLRALWDEGHSTAEIGRRMGLSKNAVVGKAHRLNLRARPSPIRAVGTGKPRCAASPRPKPPTLGSLTAGPGVSPAPSPPAREIAPPIQRSSEPLKLGTARCCWPIGEPGTSEFRFCDDVTAAGRSYCPAHCALAYAKPRDRRPACPDGRTRPAKESLDGQPHQPAQHNGQRGSSPINPAPAIERLESLG